MSSCEHGTGMWLWLILVVWCVVFLILLSVVLTILMSKPR